MNQVKDEKPEKDRLKEVSAITNAETNITSQLLPKAKEVENYLYDKEPLFKNKKIPTFIRYYIPVFLFATIGCFIWSNCSHGATLTANGVILSYTTEIFELKYFTLTNSVSDMWTAGIYPLSILILLFSGVWPYLKLVLLLVCWVTPLQYLGFKYRERILIVLDTLGKYSLLDSYVMVMMIVAFRFQISNNMVVPIEADIIVDPNVGIFTLIIGTIFSMIWTHIILYYHRKTKHVEITNKMNDKIALGNLTFKKHLWLKYVVFVLLLGSAVLLVFGAVSTSFDFEFQGAAGWALGENNKFSYSLISLGQQLPDDTRDPTSIGTIFLLVVYYLFSFGFSMLFLIILTILWAVPMTIKYQKRIFVFAEMLNAWASTEVFVLAIIACIVEIRQFAEFMVEPYCQGAVDTILKIADITGLMNLNGNDNCFDVITTLQEGCWLLFSSAVIYMILAYVVLRLLQRSLDRRIEKMNHIQNYDASESESDQQQIENNQV